MGVLASIPIIPVRGHSYFHVMANIRCYEKQFSARYEASYMWFFAQCVGRKVNGLSEEHSWQLLQRNWDCYHRPLKEGSLYVLSKHGGKKWKKRFCVLQCDYSLTIYKSEEDYLNDKKPKASTKYSGYVVTGDVDGHLHEQLTAAARDFGYVNPDINAFGKKVTLIGQAGERPTQHVFLVDHPWRGTTYFAAETAIEKDQWLKALRDGVRHLDGCQCCDKIGKQAFAFAVEQSVRLQEFYFDCSMLSGTQQEILTDLISSFQSADCKDVVLPRITGGIVSKYKAWHFVLTSIHDLIHDVVKKKYLTWRSVCEERCHAKREQIIENLPKINAAYQLTSNRIQESLSECFDPILKEKILPSLPELINNMSDSLVSPIKATRELFKTLIEGLIKQASISKEFANNIDQYFLNHLDFSPRNPEFTCPGGDMWNHPSAQVSFLESIFPQTDFDVPLRRVYTYQQKLLDSSVNTFETFCGDFVKKNDGKLTNEAIVEIQNHVLKKLDYDILLAQKRFFRDILLSATMERARESIELHCKPKMLDFQSTIPEDVQCYLPINNLFTEVLTKRFDELVNPVLTTCMQRIGGETLTKLRSSSDSRVSLATIDSLEGDFTLNEPSEQFKTRRNSTCDPMSECFQTAQPIFFTSVDGADIPSTCTAPSVGVGHNELSRKPYKDSESGECAVGDMDGETGEWFPPAIDVIKETNEEDKNEPSRDGDGGHSEPHSVQDTVDADTGVEVRRVNDCKLTVSQEDGTCDTNEVSVLRTEAPKRSPGKFHSNFVSKPGNSCRANCGGCVTDSGEPSGCVCNGIADDSSNINRCIMIS